MTAPVDRYRAGIETLLALSPGRAHLISDALAAEAPEFARLMVEFAFADIFTRPGLDLRARLFVAIGALAAQGGAPAQLRWFVGSALANGVRTGEVIEALMQVSLFAGFGSAANALEVCRDQLADQRAGESCPVPAAASR